MPIDEDVRYERMAEKLAGPIFETMASEALHAPAPPPLPPEQRVGEGLMVLLTRVLHAFDTLNAQLKRDAEDFVVLGRASRARETLQVVLDASLLRQSISNLVTASRRTNGSHLSSYVRYQRTVPPASPEGWRGHHVRLAESDDRRVYTVQEILKDGWVALTELDVCVRFETLVAVQRVVCRTDLPFRDIPAADRAVSARMTRGHKRRIKSGKSSAS